MIRLRLVQVRIDGSETNRTERVGSIVADD